MGRRLERGLAAEATGTATSANENGRRRRLPLRFPRCPRRGSSSLRSPKTSLPPPARASLVLDCWCGLPATLELLASCRADIGVRAMWPAAVPTRHCCRNSPPPYRLLLHLGPGEEAKDLDVHIEVVVTGDVSEQNSLSRRVEMARLRVVKVHVLCAEMLAMLVKSRPSARTGVVGGGRVIGGNEGLLLLRRRRRRRFLGPCLRRSSDVVGWDGAVLGEGKSV